MSWHHRLIGRAARLYWRVRKPRTLGVRAIVLDEKDRVALVRHTYTDGWYLPGGGVKKGESFETALHRELKEEVALSNAKIERVLGIYHSRRDAKDDHIVIFAVRVADRAAQDPRRTDRMEIEDVRWFPMDGMPASVSPATRRRLAEYQAGIVGLGAW
ncbi:MAG TPA: NUDIX domain-containing protein [Rhizomicrobium sp.]|nr:NUDIX domain-containing protein [Rhizomicrobium sp.]